MLSILLGHKVVKIAHFCFKGEKIALLKLGQLDFDSDLFEPGGAEKAGQGIKNFLKANGIRPQKTVFCLSHHDIVSWELVLPLLSRREVETIIVNEIEKAPRFASNPYVYSYQLHEYPFDHNTKAVYYVFQRSLLRSAEKIVRLAGCRPVAFDICPLSILNSFAKSKAERALVYMDDKASHLMACRGQECRSSSLFNVGTEDLGAGTDLTKDSALRRFAGDIGKLLKNFYDSENANQLPVVFAGAYPFTDHFFKQLATLTGHDCAPFVFSERAFILPQGVTMADLTRCYAPVVGAIFRLRGQQHYFNIFNIWDIRKTPDLVRGFWMKIVGLVLCCAAAGFWVLAPHLRQVRALEMSLSALSEQASALQSETLDLQTKRRATESLKAELFRQAQIVRQVQARSWKDLFGTFNKSIPDEIWLENVSYDQRETILIKGDSLNLNAIAELVQRLKNNGRFSQVRLVSTDERKVKDELLYQFVVELKFSDQGG